jgi:hypothetical protein
MKNIVITCHGGALYGAYEIGWMKRLDEVGILKQVNAAVGTSAGGLCVGLLGKYIDDIDKAIAVWLQIHKNTDVYSREMNIPTIIFQGIVGSASILNPTPLYKILEKEFAGMRMSQFKIPVYVTATKVQDGVYIDGGVGANFPIQFALTLQPTHLINLGVSPDVPPDVLKVFSGDDDALQSLRGTSAIPIVFPPLITKGKKLTFVELGMKLPNLAQDIWEEQDWHFLEMYEKLAGFEGKAAIKKIGGYPSTPLNHDSLDCTHVKEDFDRGYSDARVYLTDLVVTNFLS